MKSNRSSSSIVAAFRAGSFAIATVWLGLGVSAGTAQAQIQSRSPSKPATSSLRESGKATTMAGPYRLTIETMRYLAEGEVQIGMDRTLLMRGMKMHSGGDKFEDEHEGEGGGGKAGGGVGFTGGGGGATGRFDYPNLRVAMRVETPRSLAKKKHIIEIDAQYRLADNLSHEVSPEVISGMTFMSADEVEPSSGLRYLYVALPDLQATSLTELEGALRVEGGELHVVTLPAADLRRANAKTLGDMNVKIGPLKKVKDGWELPIAMPAPKRELGAMKDPFAAAQAMMMAGLKEDVRATLTDSTGAAHPATFNAAGGGASSFSFGTGSSSGFGEFGRKPTRPERRKPKAADAEPQTVNTLSFPAIAGGAAPASVTVTIVKRTGEGEAFPFKFTNITLPAR
jgi:hypothetical protein